MGKCAYWRTLNKETDFKILNHLCCVNVYHYSTNWCSESNAQGTYRTLKLPETNHNYLDIVTSDILPKYLDMYHEEEVDSQEVKFKGGNIYEIKLSLQRHQTRHLWSKLYPPCEPSMTVSNFSWFAHYTIRHVAECLNLGRLLIAHHHRGMSDHTNIVWHPCFGHPYYLVGCLLPPHPTVCLQYHWTEHIEQDRQAEKIPSFDDKLDSALKPSLPSSDKLKQVARYNAWDNTKKLSGCH